MVQTEADSAAALTVVAVDAHQVVLALQLNLGIIKGRPVQRDGATAKAAEELVRSRGS